VDESNTCDKYLPPALMHDVKMVRNVVLDRTFRFIRHRQKDKARIPLWIDKLSIPQNPSPEKDIAMHSMDLVYKRCNYAVGYLWVQINTADELDRLSALLGNRIIDCKFTRNYLTFKEGIEKKVINEVLTFSRALQAMSGGTEPGYTRRTILLARKCGFFYATQTGFHGHTTALTLETFLVNS
jgi:hypothetical protein